MFVIFVLDHFIHVLLAFVVLSLVSSVTSQVIGWEERLQNDLFCVEWDVKPYLSNQLLTNSYRYYTILYLSLCQCLVA